MVSIRALLDGTAALSRFDSASSTAASGIGLVLGIWVGAVLLVAGGTRLAATRGGRTQHLLDRVLDVLAPGLAGRVLRTALGLGGVLTGVLGSGLVSPAASTAALAPPTPGPAPAGPGRHGSPAVGHPAVGHQAVGHQAVEHQAVGHPAVGHPGPAGGRPDTRNLTDDTDLWPLSTRARGPVDPLGPLGFGGDPDGQRSEVAPGTEVVVRRGDTLWSIAARELPRTAANGRVEARWHRWYEHNRAVIGADPDLLLPGQVLRAPS